ncbi:hypothetical protein Poli38472_000759 [Pythium oligandrum]|uniref:Uncharacterized protein n=1 Tax=Pythium oligandrum TaxID=41045 RepID=A0A8K1CEE7_PYTOL|nr:hypothetical protein Poli38472_000759 [Pythium oligandrum]|eukprot:TMW60717.1 hypothetical protein Poli38472_000759 [Pythium oligandrum]
MAAATPIKWKSEKLKREVPATLEPLEHKPTPKEDFEVMQLSKKPNREGSKYIKPRPVILESLGPPSQFDFVTQQPRIEQPDAT